MYFNQKLKVSYSGVTSICFSVSNGVKQGWVAFSHSFWGVYRWYVRKRKESGYGCKKVVVGLLLQMTYFNEPPLYLP